MQERPPQNFIRLGYSSIAANRIEPGVHKLAELIHEMI
jgi:GntR family transcriptional regulator/MocR family aminotransferase